MELSTREKIIRIGAVAGAILVVIVGLLLINNYRERAADASRLADMAIMQSALHRLYLDQASFELQDGCEPGAFMRDAACAQSLAPYIGNDAFLRDPAETDVLCTVENCGTRTCEYTVGQPFDRDGYRIYFHLETGADGLGAGCHYIDQNGIN